VEFALVAPVFIVLMMALIELANLFFVRNEMVGAAREAVRRVAVNQLDADGLGAFVADRLATVTDATVEAHLYETVLDPGPGRDVTVLVSVPLAQALIFGEGIISSFAERETPEGEKGGGGGSGNPQHMQGEGEGASGGEGGGGGSGGEPDGPPKLRASATMLKE